MHQAYGGVVPELASRDHVRRLLPLVREALAEAQSDRRFDRRGRLHRRPRADRGLAGGGRLRHRLWPWPGASPRSGFITWKGISWRPCSSPMPPAFPISGAAGLGWPYPTGGCGGARAGTGYWARPWTMPRGRPSTRPPSCSGFPIPAAPPWPRSPKGAAAAQFVFPRPMLDRPGLDFSFSGLKTAALVALRGRDLRGRFAPMSRAASRKRWSRHWPKNAGARCEQTGHRRLVDRRRRRRESPVARTAWPAVVRELNAELYFPRTEFCTDNGAMIALAGCLRFAAGMRADLGMSARANWELGSLGD